MARIDWVKSRLNNWAIWKAANASGGSGFGSQAAFLGEPTGGYRESKVPIDDVDASVTDEAVESLAQSRPHLYATLQCIYPLGMGIKATARHFQYGESTIKAHLDIADGVLAQWFSERSQRAAEIRAAVQRSFTA